MPLHYLRPEDEPRECPRCGGDGYAVNCGPTDRERGDLWACGTCDGSGQLGNAQPDVQVVAIADGYVAIPTGQRVEGLQLKGLRLYHGDTEAAALAAARKAAGVEE